MEILLQHKTKNTSAQGISEYILPEGMKSPFDYAPLTVVVLCGTLTLFYKYMQNQALKGEKNEILFQM